MLCPFSSPASKSLLIRWKPYLVHRSAGAIPQISKVVVNLPLTLYYPNDIEHSGYARGFEGRY